MKHKKKFTLILSLFILFSTHCFGWFWSIPFGNRQKLYKAENITIKQTNSLNQGATADCGFYALYNALCLASDKYNLLDKTTLTSYLVKAKKYVQATNGYSTWIGSYDIESIRDTFEVFEKVRDEIVVVDNIHEFKQALELAKQNKLDPSLKLYYKDHPFMQAIKALRQGKSKFFILNLASSNLENHNAGTHWIALKGSWNDSKNAVIICTNSCHSNLSKHQTVIEFGNFIFNQAICLF